MNVYQKIFKNQKNNFNQLISNINEKILNNLVNLFIKYQKKNIYFAGVGKSGNLASHLSDIFKSIGFKSFYLNIMNSTHGDLGCIKNDDLILFFSKSGSTKEILDIVDIFNCYKILITSNENGKISNKVNDTFIVPLVEEGDIHFNLIPSNSITNNLIYFNFVFNMLVDKKGMKLDEYKLNHPSGDIGFRTKKIKDFINNDVYVCNDINISIKNVLELLKVNKMGIIFKNNSKFYGILTNKDILNIFSAKDINLDQKIKDYININPFILEDSNSLISGKIEKIKEYKYFKFIPILDNGEYVGVLDNSKILKYL